MIAITEATYKPSSLQIYSGNPLIEALPDYLTFRTASIRQMLRKEPAMPHPQANRRQRCAWLMNLNEELFIELPRHVQLQEMVDLIIRQGYQHRNPITEQRARAMQQAYERLQSGDKNAMVNFGAKMQDPLSVSVVGCSGIGKTTAITRILNLYPHVLHHNANRLGAETLQVTYLKVECPHDGSVKSLCTNVIRALDAATGQDYESAYVKARSTLESLKSHMIHLLSVHYVGLLVIDEIQNLTVNKKNKEQLFNFIVSLSNTLVVPILYAGTPKVLDFMSSDLRVARRFGSFGAIRWDHLLQNGNEWKVLIRELWRFNVLDDAGAEMPADVEAAFYECSQGIIDVLVKLFILTQMDALVRNLKRFEIKRIRSVYAAYFQSVAPMITALKNNDVIALQQYQDITLNVEAFRQAKQQLLEEVAEATAEGMEDELSSESSEFSSYIAILAKMGVEVTPEIEAALKDAKQNPTDVVAQAIRQKVQEQAPTNKPRDRVSDQKAEVGELV